VDRQGESTPIAEIGKILVEPRLSPDGRRIAFRTPAPNCDIWAHDIERGTTTRVTHEGDNHGVAWSPDGRRVAFCRFQSPQWKVFTANADGSGPAEMLVPREVQRAYTSSFSPDGDLLLLESQGEATGADVEMVSVGEGSVRALFASRFDERAPVFSPDGRSIAYTSNEAGRSEVYVVSYPGLDGRVQISTSGGVEPVWSRSGEELFFRSDRQMLAVDVAAGPPFAAGRPRLLFEGDHAGAGAVGSALYDVSPDGQRFVMVRQRAGAAGAEIHVVLNWLEELGR
jgi:serine/threonine-protein kinase